MNPSVPADGIAPPFPSGFDRRAFDYSDLANWMTQMDQTIRHTRRTLGALTSPGSLSQAPSSHSRAKLGPSPAADGLGAPLARQYLCRAQSARR
jgi:hypothetical protein